MKNIAFFILVSCLASKSSVDFHHISFVILYKVGRASWVGDQPVARPLPTHRTTQTQNELTQASMRCVGFEPTIPPFERAKRVHVYEGICLVVHLTSLKNRGCISQNEKLISEPLKLVRSLCNLKIIIYLEQPTG
jgi:hypothetical protein